MKTYPDLEALSLFSKVVEAGSFSAVSQMLRIPKATLSRKISHLEQTYGAQLLVRTTRNLQPTEIGLEVLRRANMILSIVEDSLQVVSSKKLEPEGPLRISAGVEFGTCVLSPLLDSFSLQFPKIEIELDLTGRRADLIYENFDLGIRIGPLSDSTLASRKLGSFTYGLFASPALLKKLKAPRSPRDLKKWPTLAFTRANKNESWKLVRNSTEEVIPINPKFSSNNYWALRNAAVNDRGAVFMPSFLAKDVIEKRKLIRILPEWKSESIDVHAVYPAQKYVSAKVRLLIDHLVDTIKPKGL
jgi:LysR family transcriptional regulator, regulator for bpeEF and oprC